MATVRSLITGSMRLLGVLSSGEDASASDAQDALASLNSMLDSWSTERLSVMASTERVVTLTSQKQTYTVGTGGDINIPRPSAIYDVSAIYQNSPQSAYLPIEEFTLDQYAAFPVIAYATPIPVGYYFDPGYPYSSLKFVGQPTAGTQLRFWSWDQLSQYTSINATLALPPGYEKALRYNLAIELAPEYAVSVSAEVAKGAEESKANVQRLNVQDVILAVDPALVNRRGGGWNRITGDVV